MVDDAANRVTIEDCVDLETCYTLANQIKQRFNSHLSYETDGRWLYIKPILDAAGDDPAGTHTITASVYLYGGSGTIDPDGVVEVDAGDSQIVTMTPSEFSYVNGIYVDGELVAGTSYPTYEIAEVVEYTFTNVVANHTIVVHFGAAG